MYEIGKVYIWQNQVGDFEHLNTSETKVTGPVLVCPHPATGKLTRFQPTDSISHNKSGPFIVAAERGDLRPKDSPPGERGVLALFKLPTLEPA